MSHIKDGWFGKNWGSPLCADTDHIDTPIGKPCHRCEEIFVEDDRGITNLQGYSWHLNCFLRGVIGGANHIRGTCSCCGGIDDPDPPNVSKREAARLAVIEWEKKCYFANAAAKKLDGVAKD